MFTLLISGVVTSRGTHRLTSAHTHAANLTFGKCKKKLQILMVRTFSESFPDFYFTYLAHKKQRSIFMLSEAVIMSKDLELLAKVTNKSPSLTP